MKKTKIPHIDKTSINRILITRMQGMGDVVCFVPTLRALREGFPRAKISILVGRYWSNELLQGCSFVDEILYFQWSKESRKLINKLRFIKFLHQKKIDLVLASTEEIGFALKAFLIGAKYRVGFSESLSRDLKKVKDKFSFLYTYSIKRGRYEHEVEANLKLLKALGLNTEKKELELWEKKEDVEFAKKIFDTYNLNNKKVIAIHAFTITKFRNWPEEKYLELVKYLVDRHKLEIVFIGTNEDAGSVDELIRLSNLPLINLAGKINLGQLVSLLKKCDIFIGSDGGPIHIAAALKKPIVALFGPGDVAMFRPYSDKSTILSKYVPCSPCSQLTCKYSIKCMKSIETADVIRAVEQKLNEIQ